MIKIGLTGGVSTGKSTALQILRKLGCYTISSDDINHELMRTDKVLIQNLKKVFNCVDENGVVNKKALGKLIFNNKDAKLKLEEMTHPLIKMVRRDFFKKVEEKGGEFAVCESPLLFEKSLYSEFDYTIILTAPLDVRIDRFVDSGKGTQEKFFSITKNQTLDSKKMHMADFVIKNSKTRQYLQEELEKVLDEIRKRHAAKK